MFDNKLKIVKRIKLKNKFLEEKQKEKEEINNMIINTV